MRAAGGVGRGDAADGRGAAQKTSGGHEREVPVGFQWGGGERKRVSAREVRWEASKPIADCF